MTESPYIVREFGKIVAKSSDNEGDGTNLDCCHIPQESYNDLKKRYLEEKDNAELFLRLGRHKNKEALQVMNCVGLLQTRDGSQIEILPKTITGSEKENLTDDQLVSQERKKLLRMLRVVNGATHKQAWAASLSTLPNSWLEGLTELVLHEISTLVKKGIHYLYVRRDETSSFLKGQLRVAEQIRARPGTLHRFAIRRDIFTSNRPENRLIKSGLVLLSRWTQKHKQLCKKHLFVFDEIPPSSNHYEDFSLWHNNRNNRNMAYYQPLLPWLKLILKNQAPVLSAGSNQGISLLFPMEKLFEEYVTNILNWYIQPRYTLYPQARDKHPVKHLVKHFVEGKEKPCFGLYPDILITDTNTNTEKYVLDTKWKLLDDNEGNYGLSQADFYQMFAYGEKYLDGEGEMALIYPKHRELNEPLEMFKYREGTEKSLNLRVLLFDLDKDPEEGLPLSVPPDSDSKLKDLFIK